MERHKPTFDKYVEDACAIFLTERQKRRDTIADVALEYYRRDTARGRKMFLRSLIRLSEFFQFAIDSVRRIGEDQLGKTKRAPRELEIWMAKTKVPKRPVFTARGPDPNTYVMRNRAINIAVSRLAKRPNMTATRNASRGEACTSKGGSACDAVGQAVEWVYPKEPKKKQPKKKQLKNKQNEDEQNEDEQIKYKTIERIWLARKSIDIFLASPDSAIFRLYNRYRYHRPTPARLSDKETGRSRR